MKPRNTCGTCLAWDQHRQIKDVGECHRAPPMGAGHGRSGYGAKWPSTYEGDWCLAWVGDRPVIEG